ncbi:S-layer homology domain-containing protein [Neobacillus mesonae]|nr:S-layer homology domain-containing protein [Neobacillus mesonae]
MRKANQKAAILGLSTIIAGGALLPFQANAASLPPAANRQQAAEVNSSQQAIQQLIDKGVLHGYANGQMMANQLVTNAELVKMVVLALELTPSSQPSQPGDKWYDRYVNTAVDQGLIDSASDFLPNEAADGTVMASMTAKALERDIKSVQYWMEQLQLDGSRVTRGDAASLLVQAEKAIRSSSAEIVSIKALNQITFEVTFNQPMTLEDEATAAAQANFNFDRNLQLVNQPRLKTGSVATYIVPVQTMEAGTTYTLQYKGEQTFEVTASDEKIRLSSTRQVAQDTFEVDSFRENGVIDYGYLISAYSGGRGANAIVLDENNEWNGNPIQVISSLATRQATLTPEGGEPMTVNYVGFTQSTDGKQEPKFRLPQGSSLEPGVTYTVSSDWFTLQNDTFVASSIPPLEIASVSQTDEVTLNVELTADPGDELFAYRSIQLEGSDGTTLTAQYKVQTRSGATGVFELQNGAKLVSGVSYSVSPVGNWATAEEIQLEAK